MISHHDVTQQLPAMADDGVLEPVKQPASVRIVADDFLPGVARPSRDKWRPRIRSAVVMACRRVRRSETDCQAENKEQSLTPRSPKV